MLHKIPHAIKEQTNLPVTVIARSDQILLVQNEEGRGRNYVKEASDSKLGYTPPTTFEIQINCLTYY